MPLTVNSNRYIVMYDLETTGSNPDQAGIVQIAATKYDTTTGKVVNRFEKLVNPHMEIEQGAEKKHGISQAMVQGADDHQKALGDFKRFAGTSTLVGYNNSTFDNIIINRLAPALFSGNKSFDLYTQAVQRSSSETYQNLSDRKLETIAESIGLNTGRAHNAAVDIELLHGVGVEHYGSSQDFMTNVLSNATRLGSEREATRAPLGYSLDEPSWDRNRFYLDMARLGLSRHEIEQIVNSGVDSGRIDTNNDGNPKASSVKQYFNEEFDIQGYNQVVEAQRIDSFKYGEQYTPMSPAQWRRTPVHQRQVLQNQRHIKSFTADEYGRTDLSSTQHVRRKPEHTHASRHRDVFGASPIYDYDEGTGAVTMPGTDPKKLLKRTQQSNIHPTIRLKDVAQEQTWLRAGRHSQAPEQIQKLRTAVVLDGEVGPPGQAYLHNKTRSGQQRELDLGTFTKEVVWEAGASAPTGMPTAGEKFGRLDDGTINAIPDFLRGEGYQLSQSHNRQHAGRNSFYSILDAQDFEEVRDGTLHKGKRFTINESAMADWVPIQDKASFKSNMVTRDLSGVTDKQGKPLDIDALISSKIGEGTLYSWVAAQDPNEIAKSLGVPVDRLKSESFRENIDKYAGLLESYAKEKGLLQEIHVPETMTQDVLDKTAKSRIIGTPVRRKDGRYDVNVRYSALTDMFGHQLSRHHDVNQLKVSRRAMNYLNEHNPKILQSIIDNTTGRQRAYQELISADINSAKGMRANQNIPELSRARAKEIVDAAQNKAGPKASRQEFAKSLMNEYSEEGIRRIPTATGDVSLVSGESLRMLHADGELSTEEAGALQNRFAAMMQEYARGTTSGKLENLAGGYRKALAKTSRGKDTTKNAASIFLDEKRMSGWAVQGSLGLEANEVYIPNRKEGDLFTAYREPITGGQEFSVQGTNIGREKAVELGLNPERAYTSIFMQQMAEGDFDGDLMKMILSGEVTMDKKGSPVNSVTGKPITSAAEIKKLSRQAERSGAAILFDEMALSQRWRNPEHHLSNMMRGIKNPTVLQAPELERELSKIHDLQKTIGPAYNMFNRAGVASAVDDRQRNIMDTIGQRSYSLTSRPDYMTPGIQHVYDLASSYNADTGGYRRNAENSPDKLVGPDLNNMWHSAIESLAGDKITTADGKKRYSLNQRELLDFFVPFENKKARTAYKEQIKAYRNKGEAFDYETLDKALPIDEALSQSAGGRFLGANVVERTNRKAGRTKDQWMNEISSDTYDILEKVKFQQQQAIDAYGKAHDGDNLPRALGLNAQTGEETIKFTGGQTPMPRAYGQGPASRPEQKRRGSKMTAKEAARHLAKLQHDHEVLGDDYGSGRRQKTTGNRNVDELANSLIAKLRAESGGGNGRGGGGRRGGGNGRGGGGRRGGGNGRNSKEWYEAIKAVAHINDVQTVNTARVGRAQHFDTIMNAQASGLPIIPETVGKEAYDWAKATSKVAETGKAWHSQWGAIRSDNAVGKDMQKMIAGAGLDAILGMPIEDRDSWIGQTAQAFMGSGDAVAYQENIKQQKAENKSAFSRFKTGRAINEAHELFRASAIGKEDWYQGSRLANDPMFAGDVLELRELATRYDNTRAKYMGLRSQHQTAINEGRHSQARGLEKQIDPLALEMKSLKASMDELNPTVQDHVKSLTEWNKTTKETLRETKAVHSKYKAHADNLLTEIMSKRTDLGDLNALDRSDPRRRKLKALSREYGQARRDEKKAFSSMEEMKFQIGRKESEIENYSDITRRRGGSTSYTRAPRNRFLANLQSELDPQRLFYQTEMLGQAYYMFGMPLMQSRQSYMESEMLGARMSGSLGVPISDKVKSIQSQRASIADFALGVGEGVYNAIEPAVNYITDKADKNEGFAPAIGSMMTHGLVGVTGLYVSNKIAKMATGEGLFGLLANALDKSKMPTDKIKDTLFGGFNSQNATYYTPGKAASGIKAGWRGVRSGVGAATGLVSSAWAASPMLTLGAVGLGGALGVGIYNGIANSTGRDSAGTIFNKIRAISSYGWNSTYGGMTKSEAAVAAGKMVYGESFGEKTTSVTVENFDDFVDKFSKQFVDATGKSRLSLDESRSIITSFAESTGLKDVSSGAAGEILTRITQKGLDKGVSIDELSKTIGNAPEYAGMLPGSSGSIDIMDYISRFSSVTDLNTKMTSVKSVSGFAQNLARPDLIPYLAKEFEQKAEMTGSTQEALKYISNLTGGNQYVLSQAAGSTPGLSLFETMDSEYLFMPRGQKEAWDLQDRDRKRNTERKLGTESVLWSPDREVGYRRISMGWSGGSMERNLRLARASDRIADMRFDLNMQKSVQNYGASPDDPNGFVQRQYNITRAQQELNLKRQKEQLEKGRNNYQAQYNIQKQMFDYQTDWQMEDFTTKESRMNTQWSWQQQDFQTQQTRFDIQSGWQIEDIDEAIRFSSGRQRRQLKRQRERMYQQQGWQQQDMDTSEERAETQFGWSEDDLNKEKKRYEIIRPLQEELMKLQYEQWEQGQKASEEYFNEYEELIRQQMDLDEDRHNATIDNHFIERRIMVETYEKENEEREALIDSLDNELQYLRDTNEDRERAIRLSRLNTIAQQANNFVTTIGVEKVKELIGDGKDKGGYLGKALQLQGEIGDSLTDTKDKWDDIQDEVDKYKEGLQSLYAHQAALNEITTQTPTMYNNYSGPLLPENLKKPEGLPDDWFSNLEKNGYYAEKYGNVEPKALGGPTFSPTLAMLSEYGQEEYVVPSNGALVLKEGNNQQMNTVVALLTGIAASLTTGGTIVIDADSLRDSGFVHVEDFNNAY